MRKQLNLTILVMCVCLGARAQVPPVLRGPWTTNTPGSINAYATNTTILTNLSVNGPTDSYLFQVNTNQFAVTNKNAIIGPLGVLGQGKVYGTPANNFSGYVQPYNQGDGYTRIWNTGPFGIFFGVDDTTRMRLDSPGNLSLNLAGAYYGNGIGLTNLLASNVISGGQFPMGTVSTGLSSVAGPFLTTNGASRSYSFNASLLTNYMASNIISGGQLPLGTVSTGLSSVAGPFLTTNGSARSYSFNGSAITNILSTSISNVGNIVFQNGPATNITMWGSAGGTNFTTTTTNGWLNTNTVTGGYVNIRSGNITGSSNLVMAGTINASNGVLQNIKFSFYTNYTANSNFQFYCVNGTNQLITLPSAVTFAGEILRFSSTNGNGNFTVTNATGSQTIRDGTSLSIKNIGVGDINLISDGAAWWIAGKTKTIFPTASWSCSTNITFANTGSNHITFDTLEFNNSQGIALVTTSPPLESHLWITNAGQYMLTYSAVLNAGHANDVLSLWLGQDNTNIVRSRTDQILASTSGQQCQTVNFILNVTGPTSFEILGHASATGCLIKSGAADATMPAMPSIIMTINRVSDGTP